MSWVAAAVAAVGIGTSIYTNVKAKKAAKKALKNTPVVADPVQTESEYDKKNEALYSNIYNTGMMPGQAFAQQGIIDSAAATRQNVGRNATSAAQRLALSGGVQGQQDNAFRQLQAQQQQFGMGAAAGLSNAYGRRTEGEQRIFNDQLRKYDYNQATRAALQQTMYDSDQNIANTGMNIAGVAASSAMSRGFKTGGTKKIPPVKDTNAGWGGGGVSDNNLPGWGSIPMMGAMPQQQQQPQFAQPPGLQGGVGDRLNFYSSQRGKYVWNPSTRQMEYKY